MWGRECCVSNFWRSSNEQVAYFCHPVTSTTAVSQYGTDMADTSQRPLLLRSPVYK